MKKSLLPFNLQFFAEQDPEPTPQDQQDPNPEQQQDQNPEPQESVEEMIARLKAENSRYKKAVDKASSEAADYKKKLREKMTEADRLNEEKIEREAKREEEFQQLKRENAINKMAKSLIPLGYTEKQAQIAAEAQLDGDFDSLVAVQREVQEARDKANLANYMKTMPTPPAGNKEEKEDAFLTGFKGGKL